LPWPGGPWSWRTDEGKEVPGVTEREELERLRRAMDRLMDAQQDALDATNRALELGDAAYLDDEDARLRANQRSEAALEDVRDILEGASEDVRNILEGGDG
jgi:hypothetical protein